MKLKFFQPKPKGAALLPPTISVRRKGQHSLSTQAVEAIGAEPGESATICYDEEGGRYLLAHWPNGQDGQPQLAGIAKTKALRFQYLPAASDMFEKVPADCNLLACAIDVTPLTVEDQPGATFYAFALPATAPATSKKGGSRG